MGKLELNKYTEAEIERRMERSFQEHRQAPDGRNFLAFKMRWLDNLGDRFDHTFKGSPSTKEWLDDQFCPVCGTRKWLCDRDGCKERPKRFLPPRGWRVKF